MNFEPVIYTIKEVDYFLLRDFCVLTGKSKQTISNLIRFGNKIRKLESMKLSFHETYIPVKELTEFPFTTGSRNSKVYHYTIGGEKIFEH